MTVYDAFLNLSDRLGDLQVEYEPLGPGASIEEHVMAMAAVLGADDPYLAVLYPDELDRILDNDVPEWMQSFTDGPEFIPVD